MVASSRGLRGYTSESESGSGPVLKLETRSASQAFRSLGASGQMPKAWGWWERRKEAPDDPFPMLNLDLSLPKYLPGREGVLGDQPTQGSRGAFVPTPW